MIRSIAPKFDSIRFWLYVGEETITSTRPVAGSSTTTEPHRPASPSIATRWARMFRLSTRSFPSIVEPLSLSSEDSSSVERFWFEAVR